MFQFASEKSQPADPLLFFHGGTGLRIYQLQLPSQSYGLPFLLAERGAYLGPSSAHGQCLSETKKLQYRTPVCWPHLPEATCL